MSGQQTTPNLIFELLWNKVMDDSNGKGCIYNLSPKQTAIEFTEWLNSARGKFYCLKENTIGDSGVVYTITDFNPLVDEINHHKFMFTDSKQVVNSFIGYGIVICC